MGLFALETHDKIRNLPKFDANADTSKRVAFFRVYLKKVCSVCCRFQAGSRCLFLNLKNSSMSFLTQIFGSRNQRLLKQYQKTVREINALESAIAKLTDAELQARTPQLKERFAKGEKLDDL